MSYTNFFESFNMSETYRKYYSIDITIFPKITSILQKYETGNNIMLIISTK